MLENKNRIEDMKRHLYDREDITTEHTHPGVLHPVAHHVATSWEESHTSNTMNGPMKKPPMSIFKKFFITALVFFVGAFIFAGYMFSKGGVTVSSDKIDISVLGNAFIKGGEELPLQIEIVNHNNANLDRADLIVEYPRGASDAVADVVRLPRETIGAIKKGATITRPIKVTLYGEEKSIRTIKVTLEYHPEGSNAIFTKVKEYSVTISSAPLSLIVDAPDRVTSDQPITFKVTASLNTALPAGATMLQVSYPPNFIFEEAAPAPSFGNTIWNLAELTQVNPVTILIKGRMIGQDGDQQVFHVYAGTTNPSDQSIVNVVYNSLLKTITLSKPFLEAHILVNNQDLPEYTTSGGDTVNASVSWTNNLSTQITDAQIIVGLSGNAYDKNTIDALEGFYDSAHNQIIWDKNSVSDFTSVGPGAQGIVNFKFKPISRIGLDTSSTKDPQVVLSVSIRGRQPLEGSSSNEINNFSKKVVKITSDFQIAAGATFSSGPLPPKAESETNYKVTWTLSNSANTVTEAQARASLPIYVKWVSPASDTKENISYNSTTREVMWNIGQVRPNTGVDSNREASFIISLAPSLSQVGSTPQLMKTVSLTGIDMFTGTTVKGTRGPLTTLLSNDPSFKSGQERVIQ